MERGNTHVVPKSMAMAINFPEELPTLGVPETERSGNENIAEEQ